MARLAADEASLNMRSPIMAEVLDNPIAIQGFIGPGIDDLASDVTIHNSATGEQSE
jgi:hypothetical protein